MIKKRWGVLSRRIGIAVFVSLVLTGCKSVNTYRHEADRAALNIIEQKQREALNRTEPFVIEQPEQTLRKKLLIDQELPYSSPASLGTRHLEIVPHMPRDDYFKISDDTSEYGVPWETTQTLIVPFLEALQIGARNSRDYQTQKESVFIAALDLDLERDEFRTTFSGTSDGSISSDLSGNETVNGVKSTSVLGASRLLKNGLTIAGQIGLDLVKLLTQGHSETLGIFADATVSIPLLRGAGKHIVTESLTQAERNVVYEIYDFERYKQTYTVQIAREYLAVLQLIDQIKNNEENYRGLIASARRARRLADAGTLPAIQVGQAIQNELRARDRWISSQMQYKRRLDEFKTLIGLPADAHIELDREELERLSVVIHDILATKESNYEEAASSTVPPADAPITLIPPSMENAGPYELDETLAVQLAFEHRLDLRKTLGKVYDSQRDITVVADRLKPELTLLGTADTGERRSVGSADEPNAELRPEKGFYSALLTLDLPFERTSERNQYRESLINLERAVRNVQELEDDIKLSVRNQLRDLLEARESLRIQSQAVEVAQRRVESTNLFLQAGRAEIRDLLEAQESLLSTQNGLTSAIVTYRIAELEIQRDMGVLEVNEKGLWTEFLPEDIIDENR